MSSQRAYGRTLRAEWTKLLSVPSTFWLLLATVCSTIAFGLLVCSAVDTSGGQPGCVPGAAGCGDEDVVLNSLSGAYLVQIAVVALGVLIATTEYATGTIRSTFAAMPRRSGVVLAKITVLAGPVLVAGLGASAASFLLGQPILHANGFIPAQGYPAVSLTDAAAARAVIGTALYLGAIALLAFAVGTIVRRTGPAIALMLAVLYAPAIVSLMLAEPLRGLLQTASPMMAGLAVQRTVLRADSVPVGTWGRPRHCGRVVRDRGSCGDLACGAPRRVDRSIKDLVSSTEHDHHLIGRSSESCFGVRATTPLTTAANNGTKKRTMPMVAHGIISGRSDWPAAHTTTVGSRPPGTAKTAAIRASTKDVAARSLR